MKTRRPAHRVAATAAALMLLATLPQAMAAPEGAAVPAAAPKPSAPIAIAYELAAEPQVGQPLEIRLSIGAEADLATLRVDLEADDPLAMIDPIGSVELGFLGAGEETGLAVSVLPLLDQTHYLNVSVTAAVEGVEQTRSIAVPIRLPGSELRKAEDGQAGKIESGVRSFHAVETIR